MIDDILIIENPTVSDIQEAKENNKIIICNRPTEELINDYLYLNDDLKNHIIFYDYPLLTNEEFKNKIRNIIKKNNKLLWIKMGI